MKTSSCSVERSSRCLECTMTTVADEDSSSCSVERSSRCLSVPCPPPTPRSRPDRQPWAGVRHQVFVHVLDGRLSCRLPRMVALGVWPKRTPSTNYLPHSGKVVLGSSGQCSALSSKSSLARRQHSVVVCLLAVLIFV